MIKHLVNWIKSIFNKKDLHLKLDKDVSKENIKVEKIKCTTHYPRYKKSCTVCRSAEVK